MSRLRRVEDLTPIRKMEGVPGMPGPKEGPIDVFAFGAAEPTVFAVE